MSWQGTLPYKLEDFVWKPHKLVFAVPMHYRYPGLCPSHASDSHAYKLWPGPKNATGKYCAPVRTHDEVCKCLPWQRRQYGSIEVCCMLQPASPAECIRIAAALMVPSKTDPTSLEAWHPSPKCCWATAQASAVLLGPVIFLGARKVAQSGTLVAQVMSSRGVWMTGTGIQLQCWPTPSRGSQCSGKRLAAHTLWLLGKLASKIQHWKAVSCHNI